jgi:hypothetical protein
MLTIALVDQRTQCVEHGSNGWQLQAGSSTTRSSWVNTPSSRQACLPDITDGGSGVTPAPQTPMCEGSRDGQRGCLVCGKDTPSTRAKYCTRACQQRGYRLRHQPRTADLATVRNALQRRKALVDHTIYECGQCGDRFVGVRRCESCNLFCAALGPGGACPDCDHPVLVDDLLGEGVFTRT